jgi:hypothetical protein
VVVVAGFGISKKRNGKHKPSDHDENEKDENSD